MHWTPCTWQLLFFSKKYTIGEFVLFVSSTCCVPTRLIVSYLSVLSPVGAACDCHGVSLLVTLAHTDTQV